MAEFLLHPINQNSCAAVIYFTLFFHCFFFIFFWSAIVWTFKFIAFILCYRAKVIVEQWNLTFKSIISFDRENHLNRELTIRRRNNNRNLLGRISCNLENCSFDANSCSLNMPQTEHAPHQTDPKNISLKSFAIMIHMANKCAKCDQFSVLIQKNNFLFH